MQHISETQMTDMARSSGWTVRYRRIAAFTLIELLVVVAIIALLISILLPSLNAARENAKAAKCASNLASVGKAIQIYLGENKGTYPAGYLWVNTDPDSNVVESERTRYAHWSYRLFQKGQVDDASFQCPTMNNGGHPRTNPGPNPSDWIDGQVDGSGNSRPVTEPNDRAKDWQARFMAYTANRAVFCWNRLPPVRLQQPYAKYVKESEIEDTGRTIAVTEFNKNPLALARAGSGTDTSNVEILSHRSVMPFSVAGSSYDEFDAQNLQQSDGPFSYLAASSPNDKDYDLKSLDYIDNNRGFINEPGTRPLNAVGRHHPGGDRLGGTVNFLYVDGHVTRKTVLKTLEDREWGKKYYGLTGNNKVSRTGWEYIPR